MSSRGITSQGYMVSKPTPKPPSNDAVPRSAFRTMLGGLFGLIAGLGSQLVVAAAFGAGADMDAYLTALVVPHYLWSVLASGLPFVVIPAFVREESTGHREDAWSLVGTFFLLTAGILVVVATVGSVSARQIINLTAPGLNLYKADLAARMLSILMFTLPLTGLGSLTEGIQNARNSFFWPSVARAIGSLGNLITVLLLCKKVGPMALAWGNLISAALTASVPVVPVLRHGWTRLMPFTDSRVLEMIRLMAPFLLFGSFTYSRLIFERFFASGLPTGDLSYIGYAYKISNILVVVLATGIAAVIFPAMARAFARDGEKGLIGQAEYGFRLTIASALPILAVSGAVAVPLVTVLYERGAFDHFVTLHVSRIVLIVMIGDVLFRMLRNVISRTFFVMKDTSTVPMVGALTAALYIFLGKALASLWGYVGLALASSLQVGLTVLIVFLLLLRKSRSFHLAKLFRDLLFYVIASLLAALSAWFVTRALAFLPALLQLIVAFAVAGLLYITILSWRDRETAILVLELTGVRQIITLAQTGFRNVATPRGYSADAKD